MTKHKNEERLIEVLTAISLVSGRMAKKLYEMSREKNGG